VSTSPAPSRAFSLFSLALFLATATLALAAVVSPTTWSVGMDFAGRYNEMQCVFTRVDPYELCFGNATSPIFAPMGGLDGGRPASPADKGKAIVNSYPPWAYTFLSPLHRVPPKWAGLLFNATAVACYLFLLVLAFFRARRAALPAAETRLVVALGGFLGLPLLRVLQVGNYGLFLAAAAGLLALALEGKRDWLAGVPLAILMLKPQLGLPFVLPLLLARKWKTLLVGGGLCFAASLLPAALVKGNVFSMILHAAHSGTASIHSAWQSTGYFSPPVFRFFASHMGTGAALAASMALGGLVLLAASWRLRNEEDWWLRLVPPAVVACLWSMGHAHDHVLLAPALASVALAACRPGTRRRFFAVGAGLLAFEFWFCALVAACVVAAAVLRGGGFSLAEGLEATRATGPKIAYTAYLQLAAVLQSVWLLRIPRRDG